MEIRYICIFKLLTEGFLLLPFRYQKRCCCYQQQRVISCACAHALVSSVSSFASSVPSSCPSTWHSRFGTGTLLRPRCFAYFIVFNLYNGILLLLKQKVSQTFHHNSCIVVSKSNCLNFLRKIVSKCFFIILTFKKGFKFRKKNLKINKIKLALLCFYTYT